MSEKKMKYVYHYNYNRWLSPINYKDIGILKMLNKKFSRLISTRDLERINNDLDTMMNNHNIEDKYVFPKVNSNTMEFEVIRERLSILQLNIDKESNDWSKIFEMQRESFALLKDWSANLKINNKILQTKIEISNEFIINEKIIQENSVDILDNLSILKDKELKSLNHDLYNSINNINDLKSTTNINIGEWFNYIANVFTGNIPLVVTIGTSIMVGGFYLFNENYLNLSSILGRLGITAFQNVIRTENQVQIPVTIPNSINTNIIKSTFFKSLGERVLKLLDTLIERLVKGPKKYI